MHKDSSDEEQAPEENRVAEIFKPAPKKVLTFNDPRPEAALNPLQVSGDQNTITKMFRANANKRPSDSSSSEESKSGPANGEKKVMDSSLDSFKYTKSTHLIAPNSSAPLKVTLYGASEPQNKLNNSTMIPDSAQPELNNSMDTVKTNFGVSNDSNKSRIQQFVQTLKQVNDPKLMKEITAILNRIKSASQAKRPTIDAELVDLTKLLKSSSLEAKPVERKALIESLAGVIPQPFQAQYNQKVKS